MSKQNTKRALFTAAALGAGLLGVHTVRSEPAGLKTFKTGDVLTADDLNANFAAIAASTSTPYAWSAFAPAQQDPGLINGSPDKVGEARIASFNFTSPVAGQVFATASFEIRIRNTFDRADSAPCRVETVLADTVAAYSSCASTDSCNLPGYAQTSVNANLPTQAGGGTYFGQSQTVTRMLPVKQGLNTFYLVGRTSCAAGVWGAVSFSAITVQSGGNATLTIP